MKEWSTEKWDNEKVFSKGVGCQVLIVHGSGDFEIPVEHARTLFKRAIQGQGDGFFKGEYGYGIQPVRGEADLWMGDENQVFLLEIKLAGHNNIAIFEIFAHTLADFIYNRIIVSNKMSEEEIERVVKEVEEIDEEERASREKNRME